MAFHNVYTSYHLIVFKHQDTHLHYLDDMWMCRKNLLRSVIHMIYTLMMDTSDCNEVKKPS